MAVDGDVALPPSPPPILPTPIADAHFVVDPARATAGATTYAHTCLLCHGAGAVAGGMAPDLRASQIVLSREAFEDVVLRGRLRAKGMSRFPDMTRDEAENIRHYVRSMVPTATQVSSP